MCIKIENFKIKDKVEKFIFSMHNSVIYVIPKSHAVFRNRLLEQCFDLYENVLKANINQGTLRNKYQKEALVNVDMIDTVLGFLNDLSFIEKKKFMSLISNLNEIKKMLYGWYKNEKNKN